jgi:hypothetical protein
MLGRGTSRGQGGGRSTGPKGVPVKRALCQIPVLCRLEPRLLVGARGEAKPSLW